MTLVEQLNVATEHQREGRLHDAIGIYYDILKHDSNCIQAVLNAGLIAYQLGKADDARRLFEVAVTQQPNSPQVQNALGAALLSEGDLTGAQERFELAIRLDPALADAQFNLGKIFSLQRLDDRSIDCFLRAAQLDTCRTDALVGMSVVFRRQKRDAEARAVLNDALDRNGGCVLTLNNIGALELSQGNLEAAADAIKQALTADPHNTESLTNRGLLQVRQGDMQSALASYQLAIEINPRAANAHANLGALLSELRSADAAVFHLNQAIQINPQHVQARTNLSSLLCNKGEPSAAIAEAEKALEIDPDHAEAHNNLAQALRVVGRLEDAIEEYSAATQRAPADYRFLSNLISAEQYRPDVSMKRLRDLNQEWDQRFSPNRDAQRSNWSQPLKPDRKLRIGFLSGDLGQHPVGFFSIGVAESLDRGQYELLIYNDRQRQDALTRRFKSAADQYRDVFALSDDECREVVKDDCVDVLFDLNGHFQGGKRLLVFAQRAAPLQVSWAGYVGSTGVGSMDYVMADDLQAPASEDEYYSERVYRLPQGYVCYDPPDYSPDVGDLPCLNGGAITFGCFNNAVKLNERVLETWSKLLSRLPNSRLILKYRGLADPANRELIGNVFEQRGIEKSRLRLLGGSEHRNLLGTYNEVDIALDTFPYSGGLTTCEALWMGVPVVTAPGQTMAGRHSASHLANVGMSELIAASIDQYIEIALALANDRGRLAHMRRGLRDRLRSTLCDRVGFTRRWEAAVRSMWAETCQRHP